ncbi:MAG: protein kinase, partial [bacterium]
MTEVNSGTVDNPELLEGEILEKKMHDYPDGLPWKLACHIFEQCIESLISAREHGITHCNLTPSNIVVLKDDSIKLIGIGIAGCTAEAGSGGLPGSFDYMAPEFARLNGFQGDERSDIFSVGVCFYQALTGKLPYKKFGKAADVEYLH